METILAIGGVVAVFAGVLCLLYGTAAFCGWCRFQVRWKWGDAHQMARSVRLGWNTGMPPEGEWFFVREWAHQAKKNFAGGRIQDYEWSLFRRVGDKCVSASGGLITPATNVTGWMYVAQPSIAESLREDDPEQPAAATAQGEGESK